MVSILMPVYNAEKYLHQSIQSILNQTYQHFEFIIINDGSTDNSLTIIQSFNNNRIRLYQNEQNLGLIKTLNKGINLAKGKYIARMDADDIAIPKRLEKQVNFLEQNKDYAIVGSSAKIINNDGKQISFWEVNTEQESIKAKLLFQPGFPHPSIMIRTHIAKEFKYNLNCYIIEDYYLWLQISRKYKIGNIKEALINYRIHDNNINKKQNSLKLKNLNNILYPNLFDFLKIPYNAEFISLHSRIVHAQFYQKFTLNELKVLEIWLNHLVKTNLKINYCDKRALQFQIEQMRLKAYRKTNKNDLLKVTYLYFKNILLTHNKSFFTIIFFLLKIVYQKTINFFYIHKDF